MITMSALPRLLNCTTSAVLPRAETHNMWADMGRDAHEELSIFNDDHPFAHLIPPNARAEVKVAYDVVARTARLLGESTGRDYGSLGPFEIPGSIDVVGVDHDQVIIIDWKSGGNDVDPASRNWQLWGYALAACRIFNRDAATIRIVYTLTGRVDEHQLDALDLAEFAGRLERLHLAVPAMKAAHDRGESLPTIEGAWCKHCASKPYCPSKVALIGQLGGLAVIGEAVTPETARTAYEQVVRVEQLIKDARRRLETFVDEQGPIDLGNGRMFGRYVRKGNERLSGDTAVQAIREIGGELAKEFEALAIERHTSKAAIERTAKTLACKRGTAPNVIRRIRELGGTTHERDSMPIGEYVRDRDEPAKNPEFDVGAVNALLAGAES